MKMVLVAVTLMSCNSVIVEDVGRKETVVYGCSNTARLYYEERPQGPMDVARMKHYWSLPRDDRPPLPVVEDKPKAEAAKTAKKKAKRKKKKRRG